MAWEGELLSAVVCDWQQLSFTSQTLRGSSWYTTLQW